MKTRHYCTYCGKKRYEKHLVLVRYHLLLKDAWHCREHITDGIIARIEEPKSYNKQLIILSDAADNSKTPTI